MNKKQKIGILGGTFDPIHLGHLILAEQLAEKLKLDKVLFIPSASPPHKELNLVSSAKDRLEMTRLAVEDNHLFSVSDIELKREGKSYTVITIQKLKELYPDSELYLLGGSDILDEIKIWREPQKIYELIRVVIGVRPGFNRIYKENEFFKKSIIVQINGLEVSSTRIREKVKKGESIKYLVPPKVEEYIKATRLFTSSNGI